MKFQSNAVNVHWPSCSGTEPQSNMWHLINSGNKFSLASLVRILIEIVWKCYLKGSGESLHADYLFQMITQNETIQFKSLFPLWSNRKAKQLRVWEGGWRGSCSTEKNGLLSAPCCWHYRHQHRKRMGEKLNQPTWKKSHFCLASIARTLTYI